MTAKILVVDDEKDLEDLVTNMFKKQIESKKYELSFALSGIEAIKVLSNNDIDIILLDINMPEMDGLTLLSKVSKINPVTKVIMVTAYGDMDNIRKAMNFGAFDFLIKPIKFQDMEVTIDRAFEQVKLVKAGFNSIKENETLKMYVNESVINYLASNNLVEGGSRTDKKEGTVAFYRINHFPSDLKNTNPEDLTKFVDYLFSTISVITGSPFVKKTINKFIGTSIMIASLDSNHAYETLFSCIKVMEDIEDTLKKVPVKLDFKPSLSVGICSGEILQGYVGRESLSSKEKIVMGEVINNAWSLVHHAQENEILISEMTKSLLPDRVRTTIKGAIQLSGRSTPINSYIVDGMVEER